MNVKKWIADTISNPKVTAIPVMTHPGIDFTGNTVLEAVSDGQVHYNAIKALADHYPTAAASVIMDLTVEAEAFGAEISFTDNEIPAVIGHMLKDADDIKALKVPSLSAGRVPQYLKASLLAARGIEDRPVISGCIGPFSLAGRLYDMSGIMMLIYEDPESAHLLLRKCTDFIKKYIMALKKTGVAAVLMAEPAAGLMSDDDCRTFSSQYVKEIVDAVQDDSFALFLHNCGNTGHCTKAMAITGSAGYHLGNKCDMLDILPELPSDTLVMGNLDPVSLFKEAMPSKMKQATKELLERTKDYPNFVLSSGCDTPPHTPLHNIEAFFEALDEYNSGK